MGCIQNKTSLLIVRDIDNSRQEPDDATLNVGLQPALSIVIPARNEEDYLGMCLDALIMAKNTWGGKHEVILVDNGSKDSTTKIATTKGCRVIEEPDATISRLRNVGARNSRGDVIAFLDADCLVAPEWIVCCLEAFVNEKIGIVGTRAVPDLNNPTWVEIAWYKLMSGAKRADFPDWIGTSNFFIRREDFFWIGGFDEQLQTAEDVNLCYELTRRGRLIYLEQRVDTIHLRESKTLMELFKREYWRGKSTLRSFSRNAFHLKELPSVLFPLLNLLLIFSMFVLAALGSIYVILVFGLAALVPAVILIKKQVSVRSVKRLWQCYVVCLVYGLARSCSLIHELKHLLLNTCSR